MVLHLRCLFPLSVDFVSAPFVMSKLHVFVNHDKPDIFFRPALRSFLVSKPVCSPSGANSVEDLIIAECIQCIYKLLLHFMIQKRLIS